MTPDPGCRSNRALATARARHLAGDFEGGLLSLDAAAAGPLDEIGRGDADLLRAQVAFAEMVKRASRGVSSGRSWRLRKGSAGSGARAGSRSTFGISMPGSSSQRRLVDLARESGAVVALPLALTVRLGVHIRAGELAAVTSLQDEVGAINSDREPSRALWCRAPSGMAGSRERGDGIDRGDLARGQITRRGAGPSARSLLPGGSLQWSLAVTTLLLRQRASAAAKAAISRSATGAWLSWSSLRSGPETARLPPRHYRN